MRGLISAVCAAVAVAQCGFAYAGDKHAKYHAEYYSKWKVPGTGLSCCNDQDCKPSKHRVTARGVEFLSHTGEWFLPRQDRVMIKVTPDGGAHLCAASGIGGKPYVFCAIVPFSGY